MLARTPTRAARPGPSPLTRAVLVVLLVGSAVVGLARLPGELRGQSDSAAAGRRIQQVDSVPVLSLGPAPSAFLAYVRRTVPVGEPVRIVQAVTPLSPLEDRHGLPPGVCGYSASRVTYFLLVYSLRPRPSTCAADARWTMYFGVRPVGVPAGAAVHRYGDGYVLVRR